MQCMTLKHSGLSLLGPGLSLFPSLTLPREGNLGSWDFPPKNQKEMGRWVRQQGAYEEKDGVASQGFLRAKREERKKLVWEKIGIPLTSIEPLHGWEKEVPLMKYFAHLMQRTDSFEKTLMLGKIEGREGNNRGWDGWMASPTQWTWVWVNSGSWSWTGRPGVLQSIGSQSRTWLNDWMTTTGGTQWQTGCSRGCWPQIDRCPYSPLSWNAFHGGEGGCVPWSPWLPWEK